MPVEAESRRGVARRRDAAQRRDLPDVVRSGLDLDGGGHGEARGVATPAKREGLLRLPRCDTDLFLGRGVLLAGSAWRNAGHQCPAVCATMGSVKGMWRTQNGFAPSCLSSTASFGLSVGGASEGQAEAILGTAPREAFSNR